MFIGLIIFGIIIFASAIALIFVDFESLSRQRKIRQAKKRANKMHEVTGKRYYVIPFGDQGAVIIVDNKYIDVYNKMNRKQVRFKKIDIYELEKMAYYVTSAKRGDL